MNILFLSYAEVALCRKGGARAVAMLHGLADAGHRVDLATPFTDFPGHPNIRRLIDPASKPASRAKVRMACLRAAGRVSYDAVHAIDESVFFAARLCRLKHIPLVYDASQCFGGQSGSGPSGLWKLFPKRFLRMETKVLEQARLVFSPCSVLTGDLSGICPAAPLVQLEDIPVQPLYARQETDRAALLESFGKRSGAVVVCSALPGHAVGLRNLLMAARKVIDSSPETTFLFKGVLREEAAEMAANLDIAGHCVFLASDEPEAFLPALGIADVILLVPAGDGRYINSQVYTLLHAGAPLVVVHSPAYDELLTEKNSVRVLPHSDSMAEGLLRAIQEPLFLLAVAHEGQQLVADRHTYSSFKHKVRMAYRPLS